jgi:P-type conjugative transfer protein TrbJ
MNLCSEWFHHRGILAAKNALVVPFVASVMALPVKAGIPVIDGTNVVQTTISAVNNVQAVAKQIQQYQTQLQQYENMLQKQSHLPPISGTRQIQRLINCCRRRTHLITTRIRRES